MQSVRGAAILKADEILQKTNYVVTIRHRTDVLVRMSTRLKPILERRQESERIIQPPANDLSWAYQVQVNKIDARVLHS
jgi:hypothetical protein